MYTKAFPGTHISRTSASCGDPALFSRPSDAGAHPPRANENSIRDAEYRFALAPERAAVRITKLIRLLAAGIPTVRNTVTNGLSVTPTRFQGITPTRTTMAPR